MWAFGWKVERDFMRGVVGIRRENADLTERRAPLTPDQVKHLIQSENLKILVEPSENRIFPDTAYQEAGATITSDLSECNIIFGVKEIPTSDLAPGAVYCYFSHTIKGQSHNMPMLKRVLDLRNTLIDYECVQDEEGKRLIFFGKFAGYAGMIDSFWALGLRLVSQGISNPFTTIKQAVRYDNLREIREAFAVLADTIRTEGLPQDLVPLVCGFTGYGHVSQGAQEIFDLLPHDELKPSELPNFIENGEYSRHRLYKVVFKEADMFQPIEANDSFNLQDYYNYPEKYRSSFQQYIPYLSMIINGIFWAPQYPRLVTRDFLKNYYSTNKEMKLRIIGDITCDIEGSIECTVKATNSENPIYVYNPNSGDIKDGNDGEGIVVLAVDKLPSELPKEATLSFGNSLLPYIPELARANFIKNFEDLNVPAPFKQAILAHQGKLTPDYRYLIELMKAESKG